MATEDSVDVIVIGAGLSGLTAAAHLHRRGLDVLVIEASPMVGGRLRSTKTKLGSHIDLGGQWIGHGHDRVTSLVKEAGGTIFPTYTRGLPILVRDGRALSPFSPSVLLAAIWLALLELVSRVYVPKRWMRITVNDAIAKTAPTETTRELLRLLIATSSTAELGMYSIYSFAKALPLSGGLFTMLGTEGGAQDSLVAESMGVVSSMLAEKLSGRVLTNMAVTGISQGEDNQVSVRTSSGRQFKSSKVIITVPPPMMKSITFQQPLPSERQALTRNTRMGVVYKAFAIFDQPFWRGSMGGEFMVMDDPSCGVFDASSPDGPGYLCFLVAGSPAKQLDTLDSDQRRDLLLSRLVPFLGQRVTRPVEWIEKAWHQDEYCGGGYLGYPVVVGTSEGLLPMPHQPIKNLHFAGTETAQEHPGYFEGAAQSGERVAIEVAQAFGGRRTVQ